MDKNRIGDVNIFSNDATALVLLSVLKQHMYSFRPDQWRCNRRLSSWNRKRVGSL